MVLQMIFQFSAFFAGIIKQASIYPSIPAAARMVLFGSAGLFFGRPDVRQVDCEIISGGTAGIVWIGVWVESDGVTVHA
jgi:hypothetical protein